MDIQGLRPIQALAAAQLLKNKRLLLSLPRQWGGKTELGVRLSQDITRRRFTSACLTLAKDHPSLKKMTREKFRRIFDPKIFNVNTENVSLKALDTSCIFMGSVDKDVDRLRGGTYAFVHWAEVAFSKVEQGESIMSVFDKVIAPTLDMMDGYALLESTNKGKNGWWQLWEDPEYCDRYGFSKLKIGLSDMVYMGLVDEDMYWQKKQTTHPDVFDQEYECKWVTFSGKVYEEFRQEKHVDNFPGPEEWQKVVSAIDWGYDPSATCVLFGYVKDNILHIFDEHYKKQELITETADAITDKLKFWKITHHACVADHEPARIEELIRRGIACGNASKADVQGARIQIKEGFHFDRIKIHPRCKFLLKDLDAAVWDHKKEGELDDSQCTWGHFDAEAALRYLVRELGEFERPEPKSNPHLATDPVSARAHEIHRRVLHDRYEG